MATTKNISVFPLYSFPLWIIRTMIVYGQIGWDWKETWTWAERNSETFYDNSILQFERLIKLCPENQGPYTLYAVFIKMIFQGFFIFLLIILLIKKKKFRFVCLCTIAGKFYRTQKSEYLDKDCLNQFLMHLKINFFIF